MAPSDEMPSSPYQPIGTLSGQVDAEEIEARTNPAGDSPARASIPWREYTAAFIATTGNLIMGTTISWSGPAIPLLKLLPNQDGFNISTSEGSWVGSLMPLGALVGGQLASLMITRLGRKLSMLACALLFAVSYLLIVVAPTIMLVFVGRFMTGMATGIVSMLGPVYVAEIASPRNRGFLGSSVQLMVVFGVTISIVLGLSGSWRWISVICVGLSTLWAVLLLWIPESPVDLMQAGRYRDARDTLEWLRATIHVETEFEELQESVQGSGNQSTGGGSSFRFLFRKECLTPLSVSLMLMLGQQLSGMNAIMFYVVDIFQSAGTSLSPTTASIIIALVQVGATFLATYLMDRLGRRLLLLISALFMAVSMALLGYFFYVKINQENEKLANEMGVLPLVSLSSFVVAFSIAFGPIPWLMMSELIPAEVKGPASAIAITFNWTLAFLVTKFFSNMVDAITEAGSFWLFGVIMGLTFIYCLLFVPETKGKSLNAIQGMFRSQRPYFLDISVWKLCRREPSEDSDTSNLAENEEFNHY